MIRISVSSSVLFICDIQEGFRRKIFKFPSILSTAKKLLRGCEILGIPVVATEQYPKAFGKTCEELNVGPVYEKSAFSMISSDYVKTHLESIDSVILLGIESHICVLQTALDLCEMNKQVFVIRDGISSINKEEIEIAVNRMTQAGCVITSSESVLFELVKDAKNPSFKAISALLKECREQTDTIGKSL